MCSLLFYIKRLCFVFLECFEMWRRLQTIENIWSVQWIHLNTQSSSLNERRSSSNYPKPIYFAISETFFRLHNKRHQGLNRNVQRGNSFFILRLPFVKFCTCVVHVDEGEILLELLMNKNLCKSLETLQTWIVFLIYLFLFS